MSGGDEYPSGSWGQAVPIGTRVLYPDRRMKQVQSGTTRYLVAGPWWGRDPAAPRFLHPGNEHLTARVPIARPVPSWSWGQVIMALLGAVWFVIALPFRVVLGTIAWLGRLTGVAVGFLLMVAGMFLLAGPLFIVGIPLFLVGLVLTLRCLE